MSNRLYLYYHLILRQDLLLKLGYSNIMQVPKICNMLLFAQVPPRTPVKNMALAMELLCGQKGRSSHDLPYQSQAFRASSTLARKRSSRFGGHVHASTNPTSLLHTCLRGLMMYNMLEKLFILTPLSKVSIQGNRIQFTINQQRLRLFPEVQNHFELFENIQAFQVVLVTSSKTEHETRLLWTGIAQKEAFFHVKPTPKR